MPVSSRHANTRSCGMTLHGLSQPDMKELVLPQDRRDDPPDTPLAPGGTRRARSLVLLFRGWKIRCVTRGLPRRPGDHYRERAPRAAVQRVAAQRNRQTVRASMIEHCNSAERGSARAQERHGPVARTADGHGSVEDPTLKEAISPDRALNCPSSRHSTRPTQRGSAPGYSDGSSPRY